jgi:uncharacterized tellurite resistance protein B-like protein
VEGHALLPRLQIMTADSDVKFLVKILIGTAWIDGQIQPEERQYLHRIVQEKGMAEDPEISALLYEGRAVKPEVCYDWVKAYLGDRPSSESCRQLIEAISGLIYSDGMVANEEAKLLTDIQMVDLVSDAGPTDHSVIQVIRNLYQRWVSTLNS